MRIISRWKDYYDSIQKFGQDRSLVYVRDKKRVEKAYCFPGFNKNFSFGPSPDQYIIGFCGKIYPVIIFYTTTDNKAIKHVCYKLEDIDKFVESNYKEAEFEEYKKKWKRGQFPKKWPKHLNQSSFNKFFVMCKDVQDTYTELFIKNYAPLFVAYADRHENYIEYNACLKEFEFYRMFDPYQAFQEISMYLGAIAVPQKPLPIIDDTTMSEIKGFDKYSFRKESKKHS